MNVRTNLPRKLNLSLTLLAGSMLTASAALAQDLLWSDEFDSGTQPDPEIWSYDLGTGIQGWGNFELQTYTNNPENVKIEDGKLIITAMPSMTNNQIVGFTSGRIRTQDKLTFRYAKLEARIKIPDLERGLWPAFWTLGNNFPQVGWPACGELDVMEMGTSQALAAGPGKVNQWVVSTAHWDNAGNYAQYGLRLEGEQDLTNDFHIFTMDWTPTLVTTYLDGEKIWEIDIDPEGACSSCEEFHEPHFAILNLAVGGNFTGLTSANLITAPFPARMEVDYVRVYDNGFTEVSGTGFGPPDIGPAHSGSWYNVDQSGQGFSMEFAETDQLGPIAAIYWYTYDDQGNPIFMLGNGVPDGNRVDVVFYAFKGMVYGDFDPDTNQQFDGGTGVFEFSDRDNATFSYTPSQAMIDNFGHTEGVNNLPLVKLLGIDAATHFKSGSD